MRTPNRSLARALLVAGLMSALGAACSGSVSVGSESVDKAKVEQQTAEQLATKTNQPKPTITCPGDLDAKVGATMQCELVAQGDPTKLPVFIVVDSVVDGEVNWNIEVGQPGATTGASTTTVP